MASPSIKILFVDIDWTILDHHLHDWDYQSLEALKKAQNKGILLYLCTARPYDSIVHTGLFHVLSPDGVICTNGGVAFVGDKLLYANVIPSLIVKQIEKISNKHHLVLELATDKGRYFTKKSNVYVKNYFSVYAETIPSIQSYQDENVTSILLFAPEKYDEKLITEYPSDIRYCRFDTFGVDLCYHSNNKGLGVRRVLEALHLDKAEAMSFGDDDGDIPMFLETGLSIALGNGKESAKKAASEVCETIGEHGVSQSLKKHHLI